VVGEHMHEIKVKSHGPGGTQINQFINL